ncbi:helix-loop-helix DNA-binding domain containing protein [Brugia malayi]|uniref:Helix-loop-helix DNA-binding domain containing protein n=2 Tax=Brugia malayi TaxID=6279 RepID=A0A4E9FCA0_BRUMA|nr:helix-loop-helix DNA-binding domain containing protein [Brugia malayi]VIO92368.1 helix-loop-helix DNA-binding domain containing protein [Brugia malayi]
MAQSNSSFSDNTPTFSEKGLKRKTRNESEKRRRDTFNQLIGELTLLVAKDDRKMDKSSVLKCAINFLKQQRFQAESTSDEASSTALDSKLRITTGYNIPDIVQLYMDALAAGTFCIHCSGHIEHASTSFATLFDDTMCELQGANFFDLLDDKSAENFCGTISTEVLHSVPNGTTMHSTIIQETVTTKKLRRQLLVIGYVKKTTHNNDDLCISDKVEESEINKSKKKIVAITEEVNESLRFVGVIIPLSNRPESEVTLEMINSWERRNANFTIIYNTEFVCVDAKGCQLLGYSRFDLLGTSGYDYIHTNDLLQVAENHTQLMELGTYQIRSHRLRTKSHQWIWVNCMAVIENEISFKRVRCNYRVISMENVKKFKENVTSTKRKSTEFLLSFSTGKSNSNNSQNSHCTTNANIYPLSVSSLSSSTGNASKSFCTTGHSSSEQANNSLSATAPEKHSSSSCTAKIVIAPLPVKKIRKGESSELSDNSPSTSFKYSSSLCQPSSTVLSTLSAEMLQSKRRNQIPVAVIEHYPLSDSKLKTTEATLAASNSNESRINVSNLTSSSTSMVTPAALSISPMYQQVWEELQRRSEILRQQVLQKEMELRELHLKRFLASLHGDKY